jgi:chondroitin AC lyase
MIWITNCKNFLAKENFKKNRMIKCIKYSVLVLSLCISFFYSSGQQATFSVLKQNIEDYYLNEKSGEQELGKIVDQLHTDSAASDQVTLEVYQKKSPDDDLIHQYISTIQQDGSWPDINYRDQSRSGWEPAKHAQRIFFLTKVYRNAHSKFYKNKNVGAVIHRALKYWFDAGLVCPNWWHNEIGVPKTLGPAFIILKDELSPSEMKDAVAVMNHSQFKMTGQNKVWLAGNIFFRAILQDDLALARRARDTIASEIKITHNEGIQPDYSFHQHGPQQQFGNYGLAFMTGMAFWGRIFHGTALSFDEQQIQILRNLFYNGYNWINWKGYFDVNSLGRQFFKEAQVNKSIATGYAAADMMATDPVNKQIYLDFISRNFSSSYTPAFIGNKHFWRSDMTVHRAASWFSSIKMSSERIKGAEALNSENLKGYYVADGATYVMVNGDEYNDIFPVWNWKKLPGVTCYQSPKPLPVLTIEGYRNNNDFTGGLSDGFNGITAFSLVRDSLNAKKAWFFIHNALVCLGAGISSIKNNPVSTTLNQCFLRGKVYYNEKGRIDSLKEESTFAAPSVKWVYHDNIGYYPLEPMQLSFSNKMQSGDWNEIAKLYPPKKESAKIFTAEIEHGIEPNHKSYSYIILPSVSLEQMKNYSPSFSVIKNSDSVQAIRSANNDLLMFVIYKPVKVSIKDVGTIRFNQLGLYLLTRKKNGWAVTVADPTHKLRNVRLALNNKEISIDLPEKMEAGKSITKQLFFK